MTAQVETATACPVCGVYGGTSVAQPPALLAVADVLVIRALETVGHRILRAERPRTRILGTRPKHTAHTIWKPTDLAIDKGLARAWDVVPAMLSTHGCCGVTARQVTSMLDKYVRDLLLTGTEHRVGELRYRFETFLGIELAEPVPYTPDA